MYEKRSSPNKEDCNNMKRSSFIEENTLLKFSLRGQTANSRLGADKVLKKIKTVGVFTDAWQCSTFISTGFIDLVIAYNKDYLTSLQNSQLFIKLQRTFSLKLWFCGIPTESMRESMEHASFWVNVLTHSLNNSNYLW